MLVQDLFPVLTEMTGNKFFNLRIINAKERAIMNKMRVENSITHNKALPGSTLLLQLVIIMSSVLASAVFSAVGLAGDMVKLTVTYEPSSLEDMLNKFQLIFPDYLSGVLDISNLVIESVSILLLIILLFETLVYFLDKHMRKELIIEQQYYHHLIELYEEKLVK